MKTKKNQKTETLNENFTAFNLATEETRNAYPDAAEASDKAIVAEAFSATADVIADVIKFVNVADATADLKDSIKARLDAEIQGSKIPQAEAVLSLRETLITAGIDRRRASEVLVLLGYKIVSSASKAADAAKSAKADALKAKLAPTIDKLIELATSETTSEEEAVSALRRAHLSLAARIAAKKASK